MLFWQNQLQINFALWCATSGYGGDFNNHLQATRLIAAVFRFHVYYQTTRLLKEMSIALPQDKIGNAIDSNFDRNAYERLVGHLVLMLILTGGKQKVITRV